VHQAGGVGIAAGERRIELLLADVAARGLAERIGALLAQRLSPFVENGVERFLAGAVADEPVVVLELDVLAVNLDRGQLGGAVRAQCRNGIVVVRHHALSCLGGLAARRIMAHEGAESNGHAAALFPRAPSPDEVATSGVSLALRASGFRGACPRAA
jgi:hypothetical protein